MDKQRHLLKTVEHNAPTGDIIWELIFWNENFPDKIERIFVQDVSPIQETIETPKEDTTNTEDVETIPVIAPLVTLRE